MLAAHFAEKLVQRHAIDTDDVNNVIGCEIKNCFSLESLMYVHIMHNNRDSTYKNMFDLTAAQPAEALHTYC